MCTLYELTVKITPLNTSPSHHATPVILLLSFIPSSTSHVFAAWLNLMDDVPVEQAGSLYAEVNTPVFLHYQSGFKWAWTGILYMAACHLLRCTRRDEKTFKPATKITSSLLQYWYANSVLTGDFTPLGKQSPMSHTHRIWRTAG